MTTGHIERRIGRPTALTPHTTQEILRQVALGVPYATAATSAGIAERTYHRWIERGTDEQRRQDEGEDPNPDEEPFRQFRQDVIARRAEATAKAVVSLQQAARGGFVTEQSRRTHRDGSVEEVTKRQPPDWRASSFLLRHLSPDDFGDRPRRVEVTGEGGGPVEVSSSLEERLAARIAEWRADQVELEAGDGDVVDADLVDE